MVSATHRRAVADRRHHFRAQTDQLFCIDHQLPAAGGWRCHAVVAVQQLHAHLAFELRDPLRNGRLGGVEPLGRAAEAAERYHPQERLD